MLSALTVAVALVVLTGTAARLIAFGLRPLFAAGIGAVVAGATMIAFTGYFRAFNLSAGFPLVISAVVVGFAISIGFIFRLGIGFIALVAAAAFVAAGFGLVLSI